MGPVEPGRADIKHEELVFGFVEDGAGIAEEAGMFAPGQFAEEDAELDVFAVVFEQLEELVSPAVAFFGRADVVGAEVEAAVVGQRTTGHDHVGISPLSQRARRRAWIRRMVRQEQR